MHIILNPTSNQPIYEQIIYEVKRRVLQRVVVAGDQVPSVREMSSQLTVNPNTVSKAYKELEREGIFVTFRGKGTFIAEDVLELVKEKEVGYLKEQAETLFVKAVQAGMTKEELKKWVEEFFNEEERNSND